MQNILYIEQIVYLEPLGLGHIAVRLGLCRYLGQFTFVLGARNLRLMKSKTCPCFVAILDQIYIFRRWIDVDFTHISHGGVDDKHTNRKTDDEDIDINKL